MGVNWGRGAKREREPRDDCDDERRGKEESEGKGRKGLVKAYVLLRSPTLTDRDPRGFLGTAAKRGDDDAAARLTPFFPAPADFPVPPSPTVCPRCTPCVPPAPAPLLWVSWMMSDKVLSFLVFLACSFVDASGGGGGGCLGDLAGGSGDLAGGLDELAGGLGELDGGLGDLDGCLGDLAGGWSQPSRPAADHAAATSLSHSSQ